MRTKALEEKHYIPYKLIESLSASLATDHPATRSMKDRIERHVQIRIENDILKKGKPDSILVDAAVIWQSPGNLIFILAPTKSQFLQSKFKLETRLTIYHRGNLFLVSKISYSSRPIHPILYVSFLSPDPTYQAPPTGFGQEMATHWENPVWTPETYAAHFSNDLIAKIRCLDGYYPMVLDNGHHTIPVTTKPFDGIAYNIFGSSSRYSIISDKPMYVLLETRTYFIRKRFLNFLLILLFKSFYVFFSYLLSSLWGFHQIAVYQLSHENLKGFSFSSSLLLFGIISFFPSICLLRFFISKRALLNGRVSPFLIFSSPWLRLAYNSNLEFSIFPTALQLFTIM